MSNFDESIIYNRAVYKFMNHNYNFLRIKNVYSIIKKCISRENEMAVNDLLKRLFVKFRYRILENRIRVRRVNN